MQRVNDRAYINRRVTAFACLLYIWPMIFALLNYYFVRVISGTALCAVYYVCLVLTYCCYGNFRLELPQNTVFMLIFLFVYGVVSIISGEYVLIYSFVFLLPIVLLSRKSVEIEEKCFRRCFIAVSLLAFLITMVLTLKTLIQYPGAARVLASNTFAQYGLDRYRRMGTGGFDFIYSLVLLAPVCLAVILRTKRTVRLLTVAFLALVVLNILLSGYTTAILLLVLTPVLFLCMANKRSIVIGIALIPVALWVFQAYRAEFANLLYDLAEQFGSKAVEGHIIELADILAQKSSVDELARVEHYKKSVDAFLSSPLFGVYMTSGAGAVSGHSTLLDLLGGGGLLCFAPYAAFLAAYYSYVRHRLCDRRARTAWNTATVLYILLQCVNPIFANYLIVFTYMAIAAIVLKALN